MAVAAAIDCLRGFDRARDRRRALRLDHLSAAEKQGASADRQGARPAPRRADRRLRRLAARRHRRRCSRALDAVTAGSARQRARDRERLPHGRAARRARGEARRRRGRVPAAATATPSRSSRRRTRIADEITTCGGSTASLHAHLGGSLRRRGRLHAAAGRGGARALSRSAGAAPADFTRAASTRPTRAARRGVPRRSASPHDAGAGPALRPARQHRRRVRADAARRRARAARGPASALLVASYGDGADALALRATEHLEKLEPRRGVSWHLARRRALGELRHVPALAQPRADGVGGRADPGLSATIHFRERDEDIASSASAAASCGQVHFRVQRVCEPLLREGRVRALRGSPTSAAACSPTPSTSSPAPRAAADRDHDRGRGLRACTSRSPTRRPRR